MMHSYRVGDLVKFVDACKKFDWYTTDPMCVTYLDPTGVHLIMRYKDGEAEEHVSFKAVYLYKSVAEQRQDKIKKLI